MWGQWIGSIKGTNNGIVSLVIDRDSPFAGRIVVGDFSSDRSSFHARTTIKQNGDQITGELTEFNTFTPQNFPFNQHFPPDTDSLPKKGNFRGKLEGNLLRGDWDTAIGTKGEFEIFNKEEYTPGPHDLVMPWSKFNQWALDEKRKNKGLIFRGHSDSKHTLQTSFHRNGRRDLIRYSTNDVPELARHISATIGRFFSTGNPEEHGELLYLAQHHGYPTPLLDWTESPHIAAYFSFQGLNKYQNHDEDQEHVRIYQFDKDLWHKKYNLVQDIHDPVPAFSAHLFNARDNKRALPQQSVVTFSNVYNIEFFISHWESNAKMKYLTIIDIPKSDRNSAMKDLENMGITASSLFPGLDGTCNALREKHFQ
jgi:hypothetical protein